MFHSLVKMSAALALTMLTLAPQGRTFRSGVNTVEVYATVTDRDGRLVPDLAETDFEIRDNGKPQPITVFDRGTQAITIAIMIDESPSLFDVSGRITAAVRAFAGNLLPGDRAVLGG